MTYDPNDPRAQLSTVATAPRRASPADIAAPPEYFEFSKLEPDEVTPLGTRSWSVRSQTCAVVFSNAAAGERFSRVDQPDEYVTLLISTPDQRAAHIDAVADNEHVSIVDDAVVVIPPGASELVVTSPGVIVRIFSNQASDVVAGARNRAAHVDAHPHTAPFVAWPSAPAATGCGCVASRMLPSMRPGSATSTAAARSW